MDWQTRMDWSRRLTWNMGLVLQRDKTRSLGKKLTDRVAAAAWDTTEWCIAHRGRYPDVPIYDTAHFPWVRTLEENWRLIRAELDAVLPQRAEMPSFHEVMPVAAITRDEHWKSFVLYGMGASCKEHQARCPDTMRLLREVPDLSAAMFSILSPGKRLPPHRGFYNGILRFHLGLIVPEPREQCRIRVANETVFWEEGKGLLFDDTYLHQVWNDTDSVRVVLFLDIRRPMKPPFGRLNRLALSLMSRGLDRLKAHGHNGHNGP